MKAFFAGFGAAILVLFLVLYAFVSFGGMPVATTSAPLPFEKFFARKALHAAYQNAGSLKSPIEASETNLLAGAKLYKSDCSFCHGLPGENSDAPSVIFFPPAPKLFKHGVADDPVGETYLKVKEGIRLSAMPAFKKVYSEDQLWQVSLFLRQGKDLPPELQKVFEDKK